MWGGGGETGEKGRRGRGCLAEGSKGVGVRGDAGYCASAECRWQLALFLFCLFISPLFVRNEPFYLLGALLL